MTHISVFCVAIQLTLTSFLYSSPDGPDGLGKPDQPLNAISGQVLNLDGSPAGFAKLRVQHSISLAGIDATIPTDALGRFAFELRFAREALSQIRFTAESMDGTEMGIHRFPWEADKLALRDITIKLQPVRTVRAVVVDEQSKPIENARVVFQLPYPHSILAAASNQAGLYTARIPESERVEVVAAWKDLCGFDIMFTASTKIGKRILKRFSPSSLGILLND